MSKFYGTIDGSAKNQKTGYGSKQSGLVTHCASWKGAVRCEAYVNEHLIDCVQVMLVPWKGAGVKKLLYDGPISGGRIDGQE